MRPDGHAFTEWWRTGETSGASSLVRRFSGGLECLAGYRICEPLKGVSKEESCGYAMGDRPQS